jgi:hypothetical protein
MIYVSFSSKCRLFHNATLFGSCIIHILNTGCANIRRKFQHQRVNILWLQKAAWICMPKQSQDFTPTKIMGQGFILCPTIPTQWGENVRSQPHIKKQTTQRKNSKDSYNIFF